MLSPDTSPTEILLHLEGHVLNVLSTMPGGIPAGSTIGAAVDLLDSQVTGFPRHQAVLKAAKGVQEAIAVFVSAAAEDTDRAYANAISAFFLFRKKEQALCPIAIH